MVLSPDIPELVILSQQGRQSAFGKLYDHFSDKIYRYIYFRLYHRDTAEDLTSITFMKALEKLHQFDPQKGMFSAWIYRIARNTLFDYFRSHKKEVDIDTVWDLGSGRDFEIDVENKDQWERLQPYLQELKGEHRDIVMMRIWDEMSYKEIAEVLGKNEAACKMTFSRTIKKLKEIMPATLFALLLQVKDLVN